MSSKHIITKFWQIKEKVFKEFILKAYVLFGLDHCIILKANSARKFIFNNVISCSRKKKTGKKIENRLKLLGKNFIVNKLIMYAENNTVQKQILLNKDLLWQKLILTDSSDLSIQGYIESAITWRDWLHEGDNCRT